MGNLNLDKNRIARVRNLAKEIAADVQIYIDAHTTDSVERATMRMMGVKGANKNGHPYANVLIDNLKPTLQNGAAAYLANAVLATGRDVVEIASMVNKEEIDLTKIDMLPEEDIKQKAYELIKPNFEQVAAQKKVRDGKRKKKDTPLLYVIVATGNIYEDVRQARNAARNGADIVAVIRTTAQSLLDYVPFGPTTEGFGGTYATQENFEIMRAALDDVGEEIGRYIMLVNYASGLCMPEIVVMGALERLDMMLNDSMYGILFKDINMYRTFVDQHFSRMLNSYAGIIINTGEDNYLTTADAMDEGHTVLASDFINEQFAFNSGLKPDIMGLGHAFEIDPRIKNSFLYELAQAMLVRECFPEAPLKFMPPTKFMTGDIFHGYMHNAMFNLAGIWSGQGIQLLGMLTEAIHTPHIQDRFLALQNAQYAFNAAADIGSEVELKQGGLIQTRAHETLDNTEKFLNDIAKNGLMDVIEKGWFAGVKRPKNGGKGLSGVFKKSDAYFNPVEEKLKKELSLEEK